MDNQHDSKALATTGGGELAQFGEMSVQTIVDRKRKIVEVMDAVMKEGEHYGKIPGCGDKPSLFKAGAEVLATTFGLAPTFKITRTDLPSGHREYEIVCTLHHIATAAVVGEGVGTCTTLESKYRWRRVERTCPECGKAAIIKGKADYGGGWLCFGKKGGCGFKWEDGAKVIESQDAGRIENPDIADTYNTVLKIAKKRAQVDCILTAVGASDLLTQDLEDLPPGTEVAPATRGEPAPAGAKLATATASVKAKKAAAKSLSDDEVADIIEGIAKCGTEVALRELAKARIQTATMDKATHDKLTRVYADQLAQIRGADAAEATRKVS